ncbi:MULTISPECIES: DUF2939 domain-containing protein [unclassified Janthinobacterium]|uniref:DUF2939 domain-containing protein n=1 Tax=unclassified Janthinobacterium TaxID=2610881 RepID=UPI0009D9C087|nr:MULTISPECIES: DUF2939 domain-containing protein [unclassified Janthinobacterium]MEC5163354.1 hypothetical protein [Janthinobacterium sp. CG_S6]
MRSIVIKTNIVAASALATIVAVAAYWYWSPLLAVRQLQSAVRSRDAVAFSEHVDYPKVRQSIKGQFSALFQNEMERSGGVDRALGANGADFGARLGALMVDRFVDAVVQPESMMLAMRSGQFAPSNRQRSAGASAPAATPKEKFIWKYERRGLNNVVVHAADPDAADAAGRGILGLVFQRSGFADWKLTEVRMSSANK